MNERVDFHVHYSPDSIPEIVESAKRTNTTALGLIGRGTIPRIDVWNTCSNYVESQGLTPIVGIEINRYIDNSYVDLILLGFDPSNKEFRKLYGDEAITRRSKIIAAHQERTLTEQGFIVSTLDSESTLLLEKIRRGEQLEKAIHLCRIVVDNPDNEALFDIIRKKYPEVWNAIVDSYGDKGHYLDNPNALKAKFLWSLYFAPGKCGHIDAEDDAQTMIDVVHKAGGVVLMSPEGKFSDTQYYKFLKMGGDGIMAWHGSRLGMEDSNIDITTEAILHTLRVNKLILGGSDFHPDKNHWKIGEGRGDMYINIRRFHEYKGYLNKQRNSYTKTG